MLRKAETSPPSPHASVLAEDDGRQNSASKLGLLPFALARDTRVILDRDRYILGPEPVESGLLEAQRRAATVGRFDLPVEHVSADAFDAALTRVYDQGQAGEQDGVLFELGDANTGPTRQKDLLEAESEAPVIQLVNQLLRRAVTAGASDLHIEPYEDGLRVRMRIDGFLQKIMDRSDVPTRRVVSRLKVMAGLDIAETRLPQDGRIPLTFGGRTIDTRVSSLPGNYGERIVLRILDRSSGLMPLSQLGLSDTQIHLLHRMSALPNGIILATGPTGAGKTTTLYSLLQLANRDERNIVTVEDPIEYDLPGISQSQINADIGMTFANGLRATLRQDPDVILVGEIRDGETASVAAQAALTGHLVFSSLHANGSVGAVVRLRDLGLDDFLIAATLRGVIAQRLLRRLCTECCTTRETTAAERAHFDRHGIDAPPQINDAVGCDTCGQVGYSGRVGIFEMIEIGETLRAAIDRGENETALRGIAMEERETLFGQGLLEVAAGRTTIEETLRVVGDVA